MIWLISSANIDPNHLPLNNRLCFPLAKYPLTFLVVVVRRFLKAVSDIPCLVASSFTSKSYLLISVGPFGSRLDSRHYSEICLA